jgi:DNA-binding transcriptional regulator YiaG
MITIRNNHVFKGHKTLLGSRYVTYAEVELPVKYDLFPKSKDGFDWGYIGSASLQLAFSMLHQLSDVEFATENASKFCNEVIKSLNSRDWILNASEVIKWIEENAAEVGKSYVMSKSINVSMMKPIQKSKRKKRNVVKDVCRELSITQKTLAEILEVPEGTVSSWAVKNEIPRLGKKAIEFYIQNKKNQDVVDSYKNFVKLLQSA